MFLLDQDKLTSYDICCQHYGTTQIALLLSTIQVQDCRAKTLICVLSSGQGYVCSVFQVVKKPKQLSKVFDPNLFSDYCTYGSDHPLYFHVEIILAEKEFYMVFVWDCMSCSDVCVKDMDEVIMSNVH